MPCSTSEHAFSPIFLRTSSHQLASLLGAVEVGFVLAVRDATGKVACAKGADVTSSRSSRIAVGSTGKSNREAGIEPSRGKSGKCPPRMIPQEKDERRRWIRRSRCTKAIGMRSRQRHRGCRCCRRRRHRTTGPTDAIADGRGGGDESGGPSPRGGRGERSPRSLGKTSPRRRRKQSFRS